MSEEIKTILVVEDEHALQDIIKQSLEAEGFGVKTARSVDEALAVLGEGAIDIVWLDHYLFGKKDGLALVGKLKEEGSPWQNIPVFLVSNTASHDKVQAYMQLHVDKYYVKSEARLADIVSEVKDAVRTVQN